MFIGCSVIITSGGESCAGIVSLPDEPMWTLSTVSVSTNAFHNGFQYRDGTRVAQSRRILGERQRVHALLGHPADFGGTQLHPR